jgi:cell division protein FtsW (lipid II flippase)
LLESRFLSAFAPAFYVVTVFCLLLVLVVGRNVGGNQAWIDMGGGFRLQPSEFAKFATCLLLARYLSATNIKVTDMESFLIAGGYYWFSDAAYYAAARYRINPGILFVDICAIPRRFIALFLVDHRLADLVVYNGTVG